MALKQERTASWWLDNLLRPVVLAAMLTCLLSAVVAGLTVLWPEWESTYFLVFGFLAGLEGILAERLLRRRKITGLEYVVSRVAEVLVLLLLLKLSRYLPLGLDRLLADARLWAADVARFISPLDFLLSLVFVLFWGGAVAVGRAALELDAVAEVEYSPQDRVSTQNYLWLSRPLPLSDRQRALDRLGNLFVWGGVLMLFAALIMHFLSSARALALPTLLYFALGLALLSQGRFSVLQSRWRLQGVPIQPGIGRRWLLWTTLFLLAVALVALLLPTYYTLGPLEALLGVLTLGTRLLSFLFALILFLFSLPLRFIFPQMVQRPRPVLEPQPGLPPPAAGGPGLGEVILSVLFWLLVPAIVGYALVRFARDRIAVWSGAEAAGTWRGRFLAWLRALWRRWHRWGRQAQERLVGRLSRDERPAGGRRSVWSFFFPGRLPPRERVRYFYLSMAKRAAQAGRPRRPDQTPYEYRSALDARFPGLEPDLDSLTEAFVKARYSQGPVAQQEAEAVKPLWQRIKAALRRQRIGREQP